MGDHTVYKRGEGETTEWDDLMVKHGHKAPPEPVWKPDAFAPATEETSKDRLDEEQTEGDLEALEDDFADDRELEAIRQKRLKELRKEREGTKNNQVKCIKAADFIKEVSEASTSQTVVVYLFKDKLVLPPSLLVNRLAQCAEVSTSLEQLARQYPSTKFVKVVSDECIPDYPDKNLPTIFVYRGKQVILTLAGTGDFGDTKITPEWLAQRFFEAGSASRSVAVAFLDGDSDMDEE